MVEFIIYNVKAAVLLGLFYAMYQLLLRRETFYAINRVYLLSALVISVLLPAISLPLFVPSVYSANEFEYAQHTFSEFAQTMEAITLTATEKANSFPGIGILLLGGMCLMLARVGFQLFSIYQKIKRNEIKSEGKYRYVLIREAHSTHSFFNYIFVRRSDFKGRQMRDVLQHEKVHVDKWHSLDMLFIGILSILQWFNPFIYLFKRALVETHEFQADHAVINDGADKIEYQRLLLEHAGSVVATGFTSSFNQSIIKNRFKMMNKIKSSNSVIFKYMSVVPVMLSMVILFAFTEKRIEDKIGDTLTLDNVTSSLGDDTPSIYPIDKGAYHKITSGYGMRKHPITKEKKMHNGIDFSADEGTPIKATATGIVREAGYKKGSHYGNRVIIDHSKGFSTSYSQMQKCAVNSGETVEKGQVIGYVGTTGLSTGPHLHYELMKDGEYVDPADYLEAKQ